MMKFYIFRKFKFGITGLKYKKACCKLVLTFSNATDHICQILICANLINCSALEYSTVVLLYNYGRKANEWRGKGVNMYIGLTCWTRCGEYINIKLCEGVVLCNTPPHLLLDPQEFPVLAYTVYCIPRFHE